MEAHHLAHLHSRTVSDILSYILYQEGLLSYCDLLQVLLGKCGADEEKRCVVDSVQELAGVLIVEWTNVQPARRRVNNLRNNMYVSHKRN